jgi:hypothetical protein
MNDLLAAQDAERLKLLKDSSDEWLRTQKAAFDDAKGPFGIRRIGLGRVRGIPGWRARL